MASFTDAISQFNPYIQQLPLETMMQVGMYKQQKYEEGVQKIQGQIDRVAGLDVVKPLHKQYLQSKLNDLGTKLKTVAAGDFSNFQLVNSVGGMASQIGKDPTIQNAVMSTQRLRKEQGNIETAQKAGKSSVNNEDFFNDQYSKWLNDGKLDTAFTSEFVEYKDVDAKLRDLASKLKEDEIGIENPYMRDDNTGATLYYYTDPKTKKETVSTDPSKGEKRLDLDMIAIKVKGLPAERILNHFYNSLDSNDLRQMKIDSWAHYRGAGPESFKSDIEKAYKNKTEMQSQEKIDLALKLQDPKITGVAKIKLENRLSEINDDIDKKSLEKEMGEDLLELENPRNLEEFKYKLYTQTHLTNLAKDLSYRSYIQERKANPAEQADLARKKFQFDQIQEANKNYWNKKNYDLEVDKHNYTKLKDYTDKVDKGYKVVPGAWKTGMEAPEVEDLANDMTASSKSYDETLAKYAQKLYGGEKYKNFTPAEKQEMLNKDLAEYRKNPNKELTPDTKKRYEVLRGMSNDVTKKINAWSSARNFEDNFKKDYTNKLLKGKTVTAGNTTYAGEDMIDFNSTLQKFIVENEEMIDPYASTQSAIGTESTKPPRTDFDKDGALAFYKSYKDGKFLPMFNAYAKKRTVFSIMDADDKNLVNFYKNVEDASDDINKKTQAATSNYIAKISPIYAVQRAAINTADPVKAVALNEFLAIKSAEAGELGNLDVNNPGDYSADDIATHKDEKGTSFVIEKSKDGSANVVMRAKGGIVQVIPASPEQVAIYFPEVAQTSPFEDIKNDIATSEGHTTNSANQRFTPGSGATAVNASISGYDKKYLPQLKGTGYESKIRLDIEGFDENIGNATTDQYTVVMYVPDPKTGMWKGNYVTGTNGGSYVLESDIIKVMSMISPYTIDHAIKTLK